MKKIYAFALIFAIIAGIAVFSFAKQVEKTSEENLTDVVVAVKSIPQRTLITADMLEVRKLPSTAVNPKAVTALSYAIGKVSNSSIEVDEQVLVSNVSEKSIDTGGLSYNIPAGKRAFSIEVDDKSGVAGYIKKGDHVDVVAALMIAKNNTATTTKESKTVLLLQNIEVLVTSTATLNSDGKSKGYTIITLAVTPEEALKLFYAQVNGRFNVILRPNSETNLNNTQPYAP